LSCTLLGNARPHTISARRQARQHCRIRQSPLIMHVKQEESANRFSVALPFRDPTNLHPICLYMDECQKLRSTKCVCVGVCAFVGGYVHARHSLEPKFGREIGWQKPHPYQSGCCVSSWPILPEIPENELCDLFCTCATMQHDLHALERKHTPLQSRLHTRFHMGGCRGEGTLGLTPLVLCAVDT